ncbi:MAG: hypothetical protein ACRDGO_08365 [Actinomycetota bacterium]
MSSPAPPGSPGGLADVGRTIGRAVVGGTVAFAGAIAVGQLLAGAGFLLVGGYGLWSWVKAGLLAVLLALRADVVATVRGAPIFSDADLPASVHVRFVPMLLTIAFLVFAAGAGRRAARPWSGSSPLVASVLAAAGAAVPAALLGAICASVVTLSFPIFDLRLRVDGASAALWAAILAAAGAGTGAYLERASRRRFASVLRGGLIAYGWALGLLAVGVLVIATLEPTVTRSYVDGLTGLGAGGGVLFVSHLLAIPAQSALLLAPASGSCVEILGLGSTVELCSWRLEGSGPVGALFVPEPLALSPWLWMLSVMPLIAAILGGWRAAAGTTTAGGRAVGAGAASGLVFASLAILGSWFVAPQFLTLSRLVSVHPAWVRTASAALIWGVAGGAIGGWLAGRGYEEPGLPRPTSA